MTRMTQNRKNVMNTDDWMRIKPLYVPHKTHTHARTTTHTCAFRAKRRRRQRGTQHKHAKNGHLLSWTTTLNGSKRRKLAALQQ